MVFPSNKAESLQIVSIPKYPQSWKVLVEFVWIICQASYVECFAGTTTPGYQKIYFQPIAICWCVLKRRTSSMLFFWTSSWLTPWYDSGRHKVIRLSGDRSTSSPQRLGYRDGMRWFSEIDILQNSWYTLIEVDYVEMLFSFDPCAMEDLSIFCCIYGATCSSCLITVLPESCTLLVASCWFDQVNQQMGKQ